MGEKFPEKDCKDSSTVKSQKRKSKVVYKEPTRKSPRMGPAVNYREQLPLLENKKSRRKAKVSENLLLSETDHKICDACGQVFYTVSKLKDHMKNNHIRVLFNCPICEQPMYSKPNLKKHYMQRHK